MIPGVASLALRDEIPPMVYFPIAQSAGMRPPGLTAIDISVRSSGAAPGRLAPSVGSAFADVDPNLSLMTRPLADYVDTALAEDRIVAMLSGSFGAIGLLLAALGVYGVTSYSVHVRRVELGIRLALGARPSGILHLVLVRVVTLVTIGIVAGSLTSLVDVACARGPAVWAPRPRSADVFRRCPRPRLHRRLRGLVSRGTRRPYRSRHRAARTLNPRSLITDPESLILESPIHLESPITESPITARFEGFDDSRFNDKGFNDEGFNDEGFRISDQ